MDHRLGNDPITVGLAKIDTSGVRDGRGIDQ
jgi:hypothetical protein